MSMHMYTVHTFLQDEPFTSHLPEALFNIARYLMHSLIDDTPVGVSKVYPFIHFLFWLGW